VASNVTRAQIRTDARLLADERPGGASAFVSDDECNRLIDTHTRGLYDRLIAARGQEFYADDDAISIVGGTSRYNLPSDFYQLFTLTLEWSSTNHELLEPFEMLERARYRAAGWGQGSPKGYRLRGAQIEILPTPTGSVTGRLEYVPAFAGFSADTGAGGTFDGVNGWERWISVSVAIDLRIVSERSTNRLEEQLAKIDARIEELAAQRDAMHPARVVNVAPEGRRRRWPR
jgi:hypothetical protein